MSASGREVAHRIFAAEYDDATHSYSESDEERAPNYVVTPTGARVNRLFFVGVLTEVESVSEDVLRARVADPTGVFVIYAGQYQPDEMAFLEDAAPPQFVAVTGKARTFSPDDSDRVFTSVRPESINAVDVDTRDRWTVQAAESTLARVATARAAMDLDLRGDALAAALRESGVPEDLAEGIPRAFDVYGTTEHYLAAVADLAVDVLELVADEADEVPGLTVTPDDAGAGTVDATGLAAGVEGAVVDLVAPDASEDVGTTDETAASDDDAGAAEPVEESADTESGAGADTEPEPAPDTESDAGADTEPEAEPDTADAETEEADAAEAPATADEGAPADEEPVADDRPADEPATDETAADAASDEDPGDFEPGGTASIQERSDEETTADDVLDDEERERLEEEFGTFESGTEVGEPGSADIEPEAGPIEPEEVAEEPGEETEGADAAESGATEAADEAASESADVAEATEDESDDGDTEATDADDVDVEDAVMSAMADLDDGDGAVREELVAAVVDEHGVDPGAVEEAIQDALMAGKCYEPDDAHVKPI